MWGTHDPFNAVLVVSVERGMLFEINATRMKYCNSENFHVKSFCNKNFHVNSILDALELSENFLRENFLPQRP